MEHSGTNVIIRGRPQRANVCDLIKMLPLVCLRAELFCCVCLRLKICQLSITGYAGSLYKLFTLHKHYPVCIKKLRGRTKLSSTINPMFCSQTSPVTNLMQCSLSWGNVVMLHPLPVSGARESLWCLQVQVCNMGLVRTPISGYTSHLKILVNRQPYVQCQSSIMQLLT